MTDPTRSVCGEQAHLPVRLARTARKFAVNFDADPEAMEHDLRCTLETHPTGDHYAFVLDLNTAATGSVWTTWSHGRRPTTVLVLPDCQSTGPDPDQSPCCEHHGHPGAHTWQLTDPWDTPVAAPQPAAR